MCNLSEGFQRRKNPKYFKTNFDRRDQYTYIVFYGYQRLVFVNRGGGLLNGGDGGSQIMIGPYDHRNAHIPEVLCRGLIVLGRYNNNWALGTYQ